MQNFVEQSQLLVVATSYTYWLSQFAVVGLTLLWVYFRHHERFADFRNWLIGANLVGLLGLRPDADRAAADVPRVGLLRHARRVTASVSHDSGLIAFAVEPVRGDAEPARDGRADRRHRDGVGVPAARRPRPLARLARLGDVRRDGHREPLLARLRRRASRSPSLVAAILFRGRLRGVLTGAPRDDARATGRASTSSTASSRSTSRRRGRSSGARCRASRRRS